jgi:four helix bundle protein
MSKIERFEDIEAWQVARTLVRSVYVTTGSEYFRKDWGLRDQIQRAAVSIMSNIAEGFERKSDKEFCQFLYIAKASAGELRSLLYVAFDIGYIDQKTFDVFVITSQNVSGKIGNFIKYLNKSRKD